MNELVVCPLCHRRDVPIVEDTVGLVLGRHMISTTVEMGPSDATLQELRAECPLSGAVLK